MVERYGVAAMTGISIDGAFWVWVGSPTAAEQVVLEMNGLDRRREAAEAEVQRLSELLAAPTPDPDAAAWTEQVGTPCGRVGDELVAMFDGSDAAAFPQGWEWTDPGDYFWTRGPLDPGRWLIHVRRIPTPTPPPVEVGQWRVASSQGAKPCEVWRILPTDTAGDERVVWRRPGVNGWDYGVTPLRAAVTWMVCTPGEVQQ